ncbi:MAG: TolB family protein, partial [Acidimicrobiia bacterium]
LVVGSRPPAIPANPGLSDTAQTDTTPPEPSVLAEGVSERVPGFQAALLVALRTPQSGTDLLVWPSEGEAYRQPLPAGIGRVTFDVNGRWVAATVPIEREGSATLYAGTRVRVFPAAGRVTSFAWHSAEPGRLAFVNDGGRPMLLAGSPLGPYSTVTEVLDGEEVVAWGDGWYVLEGGDALRVLGGNGVEVWSGPGPFVAAAPDGRVLVRRGLMPVVVDPLTGGRVELGTVAADRWYAAFSPDGRRLAVVVDDPGSPPFLASLTMGAGDVSVGTPLRGTLPQWTPDGRFILVVDPIPGAVTVLDATGGVLAVLELHEPVSAVGVRPWAAEAVVAPLVGCL